MILNETYHLFNVGLTAGYDAKDSSSYMFTEFSPALNIIISYLQEPESVKDLKYFVLDFSHIPR